MPSLAPARGCVYKTGTGGSGFTKVSGLISGSGQYPILISGPGINLSDIVQPMPVFNKRPILYSFGKDIGDMMLTGYVLLGPSGSSASGVNQLVEFFQKNRVANKPEPVAVSVPGGATFMVAINGLSIGSIDPAFHTLEFSLRGKIIDV